MKIQKIFDSTVIRIQCNHKELYTEPKISKSIEEIFNYLRVEYPEKISSTAESYGGKSETSLGCISSIENISALQPLMVWIGTQIMKAAPYIANFNPSSFVYTRTWINKMYKGCSIRSHSHGETKSDNRGVAIFYLQVPENSSDLVFLNGNNEKFRLVEDYYNQNQEIIYANICEGELLFHDNGIIHAITEHKNDIPRICLIFDFIYVK